MKTNIFTTKCLEAFKFLVDEFNFELMETKGDLAYSHVTYHNKTLSLGITIYYEYGENYVYVNLFKSIDGALPQWNDRVNQIDLNSFVPANFPPCNLPIVYPQMYSEADLANVLKSHGDALRQYGKKILNGDVSIFSKNRH